MNIRTKDILDCLPLLASALGDKYGIEVRIGGDKACTDGRIIHLPGLPLDDDKELIKEVKGYIDHEAAHIRHTDFDAIKRAGLTAVEKHIMNSIEDWRVEGELCRLYPGCRRNLDELIRKYFVEGDEGAGENPALSVLNYILLTIRSWNVEEVKKTLGKIADSIEASYPGLLAGLDSLLDRIGGHCPDTRAAIDHAKDIAAYIGQWEKANIQEGNGTNKNGREAAGPKADNQARHSAASKSNMSDKDEAAKEEEGGSENAATSASQKAENPLQTRTGSDNPVPESHKDGQAMRNDGQMSDMSDKKTEYEDGNENIFSGEVGASQGEADVDAGLFEKMGSALADGGLAGLGEKLANELMEKSEPCHKKGLELAVATDVWSKRLGQDEKRDAMRGCNALRQRLCALLQARSLCGRYLGRNGCLETRALYRLSIGNARVFAKRSERPGLETAVHILLDRSISMAGKPICVARQASYALARALSGIKGVNIAVSAFPAYIGKDSSLAVIPIVRHGEMARDNFGMDASGGTPLAGALWWVIHTLQAQKETRKLIIIITDGAPDDFPSARQAIVKAEKLGMDVFAIGILTDSVAGLVGRNGQTIKNVDDLPAAMFDLLSNVLPGGRIK